MKDYKIKLEHLKQRRQDTLSKALLVSASFNKKEYGEAASYALESMAPIDAEYTKNTYVVCEKVKEHLKNGLPQYGITIDFRYQGSVPTNTHIKLYSDIDLLLIHQKFYSLQPPLEPLVKYTGSPIDDLKELREKTHSILDTVYSAVNIDNTGSKAISISGGSLNRKIDLIPANWYDTVNYNNNPQEIIRGIHILDIKKEERIINYPFYHIHCIDEKDAKVNGNEKRLIRLLKTLKIDSEQSIKISSYDIASLVFRMEDNQLLADVKQRLNLLHNCNEYLKKVINDKPFRDELMVANGTRKIFSDDGAKVEDVVKLQKELDDLIVDILIEVKPLFETLQKAEVNYY